MLQNFKNRMTSLAVPALVAGAVMTGAALSPQMAQAADDGHSYAGTVTRGARGSNANTFILLTEKGRTMTVDVTHPVRWVHKGDQVTVTGAWAGRHWVSHFLADHVHGQHGDWHR